MASANSTPKLFDPSTLTPDDITEIQPKFTVMGRENGSSSRQEIGQTFLQLFQLIQTSVSNEGDYVKNKNEAEKVIDHLRNDLKVPVDTIELPTPFQYAIIQRKPGIASHLLLRGADYNKLTVNGTPTLDMLHKETNAVRGNGFEYYRGAQRYEKADLIGLEDAIATLTGQEPPNTYMKRLIRNGEKSNTYKGRVGNGTTDPAINAAMAAAIAHRKTNPFLAQFLPKGGRRRTHKKSRKTKKSRKARKSKYN